MLLPSVMPRAAAPKSYSIGTHYSLQASKIATRRFKYGLRVLIFQHNRRQFSQVSCTSFQLAANLYCIVSLRDTMQANPRFRFDQGAKDAKFGDELGSAIKNAYSRLDIGYTESSSNSTFESVTYSSYYKHWVRPVVRPAARAIRLMTTSG